MSWPQRRECAESGTADVHADVRRVRWRTGAVLGVYLAAVLFLLGALQVVQRAPRSQWAALSGLAGAVWVVFAVLMLLVLRAWRRDVRPAASAALLDSVSP